MDGKPEFVKIFEDQNEAVYEMPDWEEQVGERLDSFLHQEKKKEVHMAMKHWGEKYIAAVVAWLQTLPEAADPSALLGVKPRILFNFMTGMENYLFKGDCSEDVSNQVLFLICKLMPENKDQRKKFLASLANYYHIPEEKLMIPALSKALGLGHVMMEPVFEMAKMLLDNGVKPELVSKSIRHLQEQTPLLPRIPMPYAYTGHDFLADVDEMSHKCLARFGFAWKASGKRMGTPGKKGAIDLESPFLPWLL